MGIITYLEGRLSSPTYQTQRGETRHSNDINVTDVSSWGSVTVAAMNRHRRQTSTRR